ncbi:MAG: hypothetical protein WCC21_04525 [Candidatus Acidiferrales bacterium]
MGRRTTIRWKTGPRNPDLDPTKVVPFGHYGAGLFTGHPAGLVAVFGLLLMGLVGLPGARWFFAGAVLPGGIWGYFLWLRHR